MPFALCGALAAFALTTPGCESTDKATTGPAGGTGTGSAATPVAPAIVRNDDGLEVRWWITEASGQVLLDALGSSLTNPVPLDDRSREILAANGFRVVSVPIEAVDRLPSQLRPVGSVQQQRLAQTGVWTDVARGATWERTKLLTMHDGPLELSRGRMRMLARGWVTPSPVGALDKTGDGASGGAVGSTVSFELVPQHQDRLGDETRNISDLALEEPDPTPQAQGVMFWRLALRGQLRPGEALVILAEDPFERWSEGEEDPPAEPAPGSEEEASEPAPIGRVIRGHDQHSEPIVDTKKKAPGAATPGTGPAIGPPSLDAPTVGEALLLARPAAREGERTRRPATRAIIALVPRTPENFRLLGGR